MRFLPIVLTIVSLAPGTGTAQILSRRTPAPAVTAADAPWQTRSEPIMHAGFWYYPSGPSVFFDGHVMVPTGTYDGVPIYVDTTIEPHSVILVPVGRNLMRPYERRREGDIAGTVGSRTPSFPVEMSTDLSGLEMGLRRPPLEFPPEAAVIVEETAADDPVLEALLTRESMEPEEPRALPARAQASSEARMTRMDPSAQGVWLEFEGARWFSSGPAVSYDPNRFVNVGSYRGFDVYRETTAPVDGDTIFVAVVSQGPLAPYSRR